MRKKGGDGDDGRRVSGGKMQNQGSKEGEKAGATPPHTHAPHAGTEIKLGGFFAPSHAIFLEPFGLKPTFDLNLLCPNPLHM